MNKVKLFLKSGNIMEFYCKDYEFKYDGITLEYNGYSFTETKNLDGNKIVLNLVPSQISAYICMFISEYDLRKMGVI